VNQEPNPQKAEPTRGLNIVLVGLMGCGKTTVGRHVAHMLGFEFVDTDQMIVEAARKTIPAIFAKEGEAGFRKRERAALSALKGKRGFVIATGGGIVTQPENLPLLKELGFVVWLSADVSILYRRTSANQDRPLLHNDDPEGTLRKLYDERKPAYTAAADMKIKTDDLSVQDVAYGISESAKIHFRQHG